MKPKSTKVDFYRGNGISDNDSILHTKEDEKGMLKKRFDKVSFGIRKSQSTN